MGAGRGWPGQPMLHRGRGNSSDSARVFRFPLPLRKKPASQSWRLCMFAGQNPSSRIATPRRPVAASVSQKITSHSRRKTPMGNVSHLVTRTAALQSSVENGLAEGMPAKDRQFVTALARGLDILRAFHAGEGMLGNQEIAHRTGLPKPTVARLTHTLTELGYLNYIRRFRKYELGASVLALGLPAT